MIPGMCCGLTQHPAFRGMRTLILRGCKNLSGPVVSELVHNLPDLRNLDVSFLPCVEY